MIIQEVIQGDMNTPLYKINRCWVSEYRAIPYFDDANSFAVAIEHIKIENEGCEKIFKATN